MRRQAVTEQKPKTSPWRPPTRRAFVAMLGLGAAALAVTTGKRGAKQPPRSTWSGTTRWIGHC
jgi:hypothetical protein